MEYLSGTNFCVRQEEDRMGRGRSQTMQAQQSLCQHWGTVKSIWILRVSHMASAVMQVSGQSLPRDHPPFIDVIPRQEIIIKTVVNMCYVPGMVQSMS